MTVTPPRATAPGNRIRLTSGSDPRSAGQFSRWGPSDRHRSPPGSETQAGPFPGIDSRWQNPRGPVLPVGARAAIHPAKTAGGGTHAAQFSRWGLGRRSIPAKQPVRKPDAAFGSSPGGGSAGDPSRLTASRAAHRCVSVEIHSGQFSRWGLLPHAPCQADPHRENWASPPPGELAALGAHPGFTTGC